MPCESEPHGSYRFLPLPPNEAAIHTVSEGWGLEQDNSVEDFKSMVYGVKFNYITGAPGYFGDLYIIQGNSLQAPLVFTRIHGKLERTV